MIDLSELSPLYLLLLSVTSFLLSVALLFVTGHRVRSRSRILGIIGLAGLIGVSREILLRLTSYPTDFLWPSAFLFLTGCGVILLARNWNVVGQLTFAGTVATVVSFLLYAGQVTFFLHLGPLSLIFSIILLLLEIFVLGLFMAHTFEVIDVICRVRWRRQFGPKPTTDYFPKVSLHVPAYNEPPELVIQTLDALANLDYPNYEVLVIDNNTPDEKTWLPVKAHCERLGFRFFHLDNWPGYKSGALNFAIKQTDPEAEIIGIIDADYVVEPAYLRDLVAYFSNQETAFVQTPQDYRDFDLNDRYAVACYHSYEYFFRISMATRNERNGIIFGGTMGLIRRGVLEQMGGWDEWCITEDAEISLRMLNLGYKSVFIDKSYGRGLMPMNYEGLKKQRFRWAFGGMQILRLHWRKLIPRPWSRKGKSGLSLGQKFDYISGALQWLNDPAAFAFTVILLLSGLTLTIAHTVYLQPLATAILFVPFTFIIFGVLKFMWAFRHRTGCRWGQALRAFLVLLSLTWTVTLACVLGLTKREGVFLRTPKRRDQNSFWESLRVVGKEMFLAVLCFGTTVLLLANESATSTLMLVVGLLVWQTCIYGMAGVVTLWSFKSEMVALNPSIATTSRTTGERIHSMVGDWSPTRVVLAAVAAVLLIFYISASHPGRLERIFRANPSEQALLVNDLVRQPAETEIEARLYLEAEAAVAADVDKALKLWSPDGIIRDVNYTPSDPGDDKIWAGLDQIRTRYLAEFGKRRYRSIRHGIVDIVVNGDQARIVNDLNAEYQSNGQVHRVHVDEGDTWTFEKVDGTWKIAGLVVNGSLTNGSN